VTAWIAGASLFGLLQPAVARADVPDSDKAAAQELFDEARRLEANGEYSEACPKFARSQALDPAGGTLLNLAACHEKLGRVAIAWAEFNEALSLALRDARADREHFAREHVAALEPKLARIQVEVVDPSLASLEVRLDDAPLARTLWGISVPVDPGSHSLKATAASRRPETIVFSVAAGDVKEVDVQPLASEISSASASSLDGSPATTRRAARTATLRTVGYVAGGLGVAGLAVGTYFGVRAIQKWNDSNADCHGDSCTPQGASNASSAKSSALASDIAIAAGTVGVAAGVVLVLVSEATRRGPAARVAARIVPSPWGGRATVEGSW
jgi:hypothetical protein